ncbi:MAG: 16S rRNA (guanine(966)-N(2))-methyltransferase RsmD, partial [Acidaminobacteraceae bacterium]
MRIISGKARGIRLSMIEGLETRPTTDRIKENIFNLINFDIAGSVVVDLFSGSGSLGLECASRGAKAVTLVDNSRKCDQVISENISITKLGSSTKFVLSDVATYIRRVEEESLDIILMDPPYLKDFINPLIENIVNLNILNEGGLIVIEHEYRDEIKFDEEYLELHKFKKYGKSGVTILR